MLPKKFTKSKIQAKIHFELILFIILPFIKSCHSLNESSTSSLQAGLDTNEVQIIGENHGKFIEIRKLRDKCLNAEQQIDDCSAQLIGLGQAGSNYPYTMQELNANYCPKFKETVNCIKNNTDCFKPFERQIISWILTSTRRMNYKRCRDEGEKQKFLRLCNSCLSSMKSTMDDCMTNYIGNLDAIAEFDNRIERLSENDHQIQLACCANMRFKQCVMSSARQSCKSHESIQKLRRTNSNSSQRIARKQIHRMIMNTMDDLKSTLDRMALTGPELICKGVDESFCRRKFDGRFNLRTPRHNSILPAMIKIYSNK